MQAHKSRETLNRLFEEGISITQNNFDGVSKVLSQFYCHHPIFRALHGHFRFWCTFYSPIPSSKRGGQSKYPECYDIIVFPHRLKITAMFHEITLFLIFILFIYLKTVTYRQKTFSFREK